MKSLLPIARDEKLHPHQNVLMTLLFHKCFSFTTFLVLCELIRLHGYNISGINIEFKKMKMCVYFLDKNNLHRDLIA